MGFTHLHVHTQFSLLDGASRITELIAAAKSFGMTSLAITDHGVLYGIVDFYKECKKQGVKPILGFEAYVAPRSMDEKVGMREYSHLILLAKNDVGLHNLIKLDSLAFSRGFYYKPRIDYDLLEEYSEGIICLSACLAGDIPQALLNEQYDAAHALAMRLKRVFKDDFYIEIQNHGIPEQLVVLPRLIALARELDIKLVATNDIHYVKKDDAKYQDVLLCIQTNTYVDDVDRMRMTTEEFYLKTEDEMRSLFADCPEAVDNTAEIADKCNVEMDFSHRYMPVFDCPDGLTNIEFLRKLCNEGLAFRKMADSTVARERLEYELSVIMEMGFVDYFLIVYDFIRFARENGIMIGPGRGSGVGSLVAYCLRITDVDPLKYNLLFERLLNPERVSMPDIDVDMCIERRQEVIDYVASKYGKDHVSQIATFGTLKAKAVLKDVGRAMHMPPAYNDKLSSMVPNDLNITLKQALEDSPELKIAYNSDKDAHKIIDYAMHLEGLQRHVSTHAAGVVIAPRPLMEFVPLQVTKDVLSTQYTKDTVEEIGLLKMDFLGLRNLTVIRNTLELIAKNFKPVPDLDHMEFDDPNIYEMISAGDTDAVFQLESSGMRRFLKQLKPERFEDIIAGISLYRPGPMDRIPDYIRGKNDRRHIHYDDERLRAILEPTYGVMVYQEQVMQIVRDLAGYSMGRSDLVRRAMAKKKFDVMQKERHNFIFGMEENGVVTVPGALRNGVKQDVAEKIFDEMMDFASYAFNKSHAAAYAVLAYRTAYLKYYYPMEFMTANINSFLGVPDKVAEYVYFCSSRGIRILPPDVNLSHVKFTTEGDAIRMGLVAVKNVGEAPLDAMIAEREKSGSYKDFYDFVHRNPAIGKRMVNMLIKAGAFSSLGLTRAQLLPVYEEIIDQQSADNTKRAGGQMLLFDFMNEEDTANTNTPIPNLPEYDEKIVSAMEKETIGMYLTGHPLQKYKAVIATVGITTSMIMNATQEGGDVADGDTGTMACIIQSVKKRKTKSGNLMVSGKIEDLTGVAEYLAFPAVFAENVDLFLEDEVVYMKGKVSISENRGNAFIIDEIARIDDMITPPVKLFLRFTAENAGKREAAIFILSGYKGNVSVYFHDAVSGKTQLAPPDLRVTVSDELIQQLSAILGSENVRAVEKK